MSSAPSSSEKTETNASCFEFAFKARSKPITAKMLELDAQQQKSMFSKKNAGCITKIEELLKEDASISNLEALLAEGMFSYQTYKENADLFLEAMARLLLEAAAEERSDAERQRFLLYKALDACSAAIESDSRKLGTSAASLSTSISQLTAPLDKNAFPIEKLIFKEMGVLKKITNENDTLAHRDRIIKLYVKGKRYYEALYHLEMFEKIIKKQGSKMFSLHVGEILFRKASVIQELIDFYNKVLNSAPEKDQLLDRQKLKSFITRFNHTYPKQQLPVSNNSNPLELKRTLTEMINLAHEWYTQSGENKEFLYRHQSYYRMAVNQSYEDKMELATQTALKGIEVLDGARLKPLEKDKQRLPMLELVAELYKEWKVKDKAEQYRKEFEELRDRVKLIEAGQKMGKKS